MDSQYFREQICSKCPATNWGESSRCLIKSAHIGHVESCMSWEIFIADQKGIKAGQLTFSELEIAHEMFQSTEETIRSYNWMLEEIKRLEGELADPGQETSAADDVNASIRAQNTTSNKTLAEVARRDRKWRRLDRLKQQLAKLNDAISQIDSEQEIALLDDMIDKVPVSQAAINLGVSRTRAHEIKNNLVRRLAYAMADKKQGEKAV